MRRMNLLGTAVLVWMSVMVAGVAPVSAQTAPAASSPRIFSVVPDLTGTTLVISGLRFGEGAEVWVEGEMLPVSPGATDERLEIDLPAAWRIQPGTYRLIVRTSQGRTDSFEVTVGGGVLSGVTGAGPDGRPAESPTNARAAARPVEDTERRAGVAAPGGTRPEIAPSVTEDAVPPYATKVGAGALSGNTGFYNVAAGVQAIYNTTGSWNTAAGTFALFSNATGDYNTAAGWTALYANNAGAYNTAAGVGALKFNTTGNRNVALGYQSGYWQTTGSDNVYVGNEGVAGESGRIRIGTAGTHTDTYLAGTVRATAFVGGGAGLTNVAATTATSATTAASANDLNCTGCVSASEVSFTYAGSASAGGPATSALSATTALNATSAADASALGGQPPSAYAGAGHTHPQFGWMVLQDSPEQNTALGAGALGAMYGGTANLALGYQAGSALTKGSDNVYVANAGVDGEDGTIRIGTEGLHKDTYLAGTVRAAAFVGDGSGLINVTCAGSGGSSVPPAAPDSQAVVSELQELRRTVRAQASQLDAQAQQVKAQALREASQDQLLAALQARLAQMEARLPAARPSGTR
jgi:hypothetical protein